MDPRQVKAEQIVAGGKINRGVGNTWLVPSQSGTGTYRVVADGLFPACTCEDWELTGEPCKHILAARLWIEQGETCRTVPVEFIRKQRPRKGDATADPQPEAPPAPKRKTYKQDWPNYNLAQTREKDHVLDMLAELVAGLRPTEPVKRGRGRPEVPVADQAFAAVFKVYSGFSARRFMSDFRDAHGKGHLSRSMCHNSVLKALESEALTPVLKDLVTQTALPLAGVETKFAIDSSGFCTTRYTRYMDVKYGVRAKADFVKVHLCTGVVTNVVTAAEILDMHAHDCPQLPGLIDATADGFTVKEASADKAYPSLDNFDAVAKHGGQLYAAFKAGTTGAVGGTFAKAFHYFQFNREEFLAKYHLRSNVESTFSGVKRLMGDSVRSKTDTAMRNEVYCKLVAWNLTCLVHAIYELGVSPVFWQEPEQDGPRDVIRFPTRA